MVDIGIPQPINGWIFQRTSELEAGHHALNSSRFPSRFDRAPAYHRLPEIPPSELDEILHGCCRLNSAQFHQRNHQSDARGGSGSGYKFVVQKKTARSPEGNVDVEPPSSMDDSSTILREIGVDVDEGPRLNMTIGDGVRSSVEPSDNPQV